MSVYTVRLNHISQQPEGCTIRLHEKKRLENEFNQHFYKYHFGNRHNRLLLLMRSGNFFITICTVRLIKTSPCSQGKGIAFYYHY